MTGAIEFLKAWKDICIKPNGCCKNCPLTICYGSELGGPIGQSDDIIAEFVHQVMTEARKKVEE